MPKFTDIHGSVMDPQLVASQTDNGLMSKTDKVKLDGIATGANKTVVDSAVSDTSTNPVQNKIIKAYIDKQDSALDSRIDEIVATGGYVHPATHPATMITQDSTHRFVTDSEKSTWNAKASTAVATTSANGLMAAADKSKLNSLSNYSLPAASATVRGGVKIGYEANGKNYPVQLSEEKMFVTVPWTDTNTTYAVASTTANGLMSKEDKTKLNGIAAGANNYTHPSSHPASIITQDTTHKFVTDAQISSWNAKASSAVATQSANGLMSAADKKKLDGIAAGANAYSLPTATSSVLGGVKTGANITNTSGTISLTKANVTAALGYTPPTTNTTYGVVSKSAAGLAPQLPNETSTSKYLRQDGTWVVPPNTTYGVATTSANGLMTAAMVTKLNGIATGANAYTHPSSHPASMITQDASRRMVSDSQISTWNSKASTAVATTSANGLMSKTDKAKLDKLSLGIPLNVVYQASQPAAQSGKVILWIPTTA